MRLSALFFKTLREDPQEAHAMSHKFLLRASYIKMLSSGVYVFLPLGYRVLKKIETIIEEELDAIGAQQLLLSSLTPIDLWDKSGRSSYFGELLPAFVVEGRAGRYVLGPTHEEVITSIVDSMVNSAKELPKVLYQIQAKFRDEARPRYGILRTKELIMADAYSFDTSKELMQQTYKKMFDAYLQIFKRLQLPVHPVEASSGAIGGDINHEFMVETGIGEDLFVLCPNCQYKVNVEAFSFKKDSLKKAVFDLEKKPTVVETPGISSIEDLYAFFKSRGEIYRPRDFLKAMAAKDSEGNFLIILIPGDRNLRQLPNLELLDDPDFEKYPNLVKGFLGPFNLKQEKILICADYLVADMGREGYVVGANEKDKHIKNVFLGRDFEVDKWGDFVEVEEGDPCPKCEEATTLKRATEVAHCFQLGTNYSSKMNASFVVEGSNESRYFFMGCYGIGVSRLLGVLAEYFWDEKGLVWPYSVAPYQIALISISKDPEVLKVANSVYSELMKAGYEVIYDDRDLSAGVKFNDAELLGIPVKVIIGPKTVAQGQGEIALRSAKLAADAKKTPAQIAIPLDNLADRLAKALKMWFNI